MSKLIVPTNFKKHKDKLFVAQIFTLNEAGQITSGLMFPQPTNGVINGAFLSQIRAVLEPPIDSMLQTALQNDEVKILFRITELEKFLEEKRKVDTLHALRASAAPAANHQEGVTNDNCQSPNE